MSVSNVFLHLTLEERRIILTGITNGSTKKLSHKRSAKINQPLAKRSNFIALLPINVRCPWNATIIANVLLDDSVQPIARSMIPSIVQGVTGLPEPVTATPTGATAGSISISTALKMLRWIIAPRWSTPDWGQSSSSGGEGNG